MAEALLLTEAVPQEPRRETPRELGCDEGRHRPHALWNWRCDYCSCLLCTHCCEALDNCSCPREVRHG